MQLLSLLTEIGDTLIKQSVSDMGPTWETTRMVNYHHGLGRMTLTPPAGADPAQMRGTIFLQSYKLADGSLCLKANLSWHGSDQCVPLTVFSKPSLKWRTAIGQIASSWLAGPPSPVVNFGESSQPAAHGDLRGLIAAAN